MSLNKVYVFDLIPHTENRETGRKKTICNGGRECERHRDREHE